MFFTFIDTVLKHKDILFKYEQLNMFLFVEDSLLRGNRIYIDLAHKLLDDVGGDFYNAYNKSTFISSVLSSIFCNEIFSFHNIFDLLPYYRYKEIQNPKDIVK